MDPDQCPAVEAPAAGPGAPVTASPARLKAKIYSTLISRLSETGPLLGLTATKAAGAGLCVFEEAWRLLPVGESLDAANLCRACHAG
jgi:hypothetical protein